MPSKYSSEHSRSDADDLAEHGGSRAETVTSMIQRTVERMYADNEENRFLEVTYANGDKEVLYFKDFNSGAMIENIVNRAKKMAIKDWLDQNQRGIRISHLMAACVDEFKENEDLPNTTNPDDWARISRARRASGSSTSAPSSRASRAPRPGARSTLSPTPVSTCNRPQLHTANAPSSDGAFVFWRTVRRRRSPPGSGSPPAGSRSPGRSRAGP